MESNRIAVVASHQGFKDFVSRVSGLDRHDLVHVNRMEVVWGQNYKDFIVLSCARKIMSDEVLDELLTHLRTRIR